MRPPDHLRRSVVAATVFTLLVAGCGFLDRDREERHEPATAETRPTPPVPAQPSFHGSNGVVFRWPDGDWVARITLSVQNNTPTPLSIPRSAVLAAGMTAWDQAGSFPEVATVAPGQHLAGDVAWYVSASSPVPTSVNVSFQSWSTTVSLTQVPLPPPNGTALAGPVTGAVTVSAQADGTTWRHPDDQDHIVKVALTVTNNTNIPLQLASGYYGAAIDQRQGSWWAREATIADPTVLTPGASATGFASWYFDDELPVPELVEVRIGAPNYPLARTTVRLTPTSAPPG